LQASQALIEGFTDGHIAALTIISSCAVSLNHLVSERQQFIRHVEAERLRRPEVYDHLELGRQQHWQVGRLVTPRHFAVGRRRLLELRRVCVNAAWGAAFWCWGKPGLCSAGQR